MVSGVDGQLTTDVAEKNGVIVKTSPNLPGAIKLLMNNSVNGVVCDSPVGVYYIRNNENSNLVMSSLILENDELAFAVKLNSPLRHYIDLRITEFQDDDSVVNICRRYVGDEASHCDM